jgi:transcriptional regulator with XRE-family HTH domain
VSRTPADVAEDLAAALTELAGVEREMGALEGRRTALEARVAALRAEREGLQGRAQAGNTGNVVTSADVRVSLRAVAEAVGVSHSLLSQAHRGKRRIKRSIAEKIAKLTKAMPANRTTWPLGWVDE